MKKEWVGTTGDYALASNWKAISIRNAKYRWTQSVANTNEYWLELAGGGDPGIGAEPTTVTANAVALTAGTLGALTAGQKAYGANDSQGFSTIYVRLADSTDPDTKALDYVTINAVPIAADDVVIPSGAGTITSSLDQGTVALTSFSVEDGYTAAIASATAALRINAVIFEFAGGATAHIENTATNAKCTVYKTVRPATGYFGLYLTGSSLAIVDHRGGSLGVAALPWQTTTITDLRVVGNDATLRMGPGATCTNMALYAGASTVECAVTTLNAYGGTLTLEGTVNITDLWCLGAAISANAAGTIIDCHVKAGLIDWLSSGLARTVSELHLYLGESWTVRLNKEAVTYSAYTLENSQQLSGGTL